MEASPGGASVVVGWLVELGAKNLEGTEQCGAVIERNQTPFLRHAIYALTGATLIDVGHVVPSVVGKLWRALQFALQVERSGEVVLP